MHRTSQEGHLEVPAVPLLSDGADMHPLEAEARLPCA